MVEFQRCNQLGAKDMDALEIPSRSGSSRYRRPRVWYIHAIVSARPGETSFLTSADVRGLMTMLDELSTSVANGRQWMFPVYLASGA